jgi:tight adherence protein B
VRARTVPLLVLIALLLPAGIAQAQAGLEVSLSNATLESDGRTALTVTVDGPNVPDDGLPSDAFAVEENGELIPGLRVAPLIDEEEPAPSTAVIAFDTSGSISAELEASRQAALTFIEGVVPRGVAVGLVAFASDAQLLVEPTDDIDTLRSALAALEADGRTALFDAVVLSAQALEGRDGDRTIVLFTDGEDNESTATLQDAIAAANDVEAPVQTVALLTDALEPSVLAALPENTGAELLEAEDIDQLDAAFERIAETLTEGYVLRYDSDVLGDELDLTIRVAHEGDEASTSVVLVNPRVLSEEALPEPQPIAPGASARLAQPTVLFGALVALLVGLAALFAFLLVPTAERRSSTTLRRGLSVVARSDRAAPLQQQAESTSASAIGRAAIDAIAKAPRPAGYDERVQQDIDRAGWKLRSSEFTALRVVGGLLGFVLLWSLSTRIWLGLFGLLVGVAIPTVMLSSAKSRRQQRFMQQLPDTLQLLSGTLKAGYGVMQALDTVVREVEDPTAAEFQRALTEARLGLPLEISLGDMAERIDSDDFRWVVVAMNIQRQVGGNLAELLETVAATLRGREQTRRLIQSLSAEGRLSAIILLALPFLLAGYFLVVNPGYLAPLITTSVGLLLMAVIAFLMIIGFIWIRRLIAIDV